jgi:hypothetical protein
MPFNPRGGRVGACTQSAFRRQRDQKESTRPAQSYAFWTTWMRRCLWTVSAAWLRWASGQNIENMLKAHPEWRT